MADVLLPGITTTRVATDRLTQHVLHLEGVDPAGPGEAVLFVHGNVSSALFWQQPMLALGTAGRPRVLAVDLRGYGETDPLPIDATRGVAGLGGRHRRARGRPGPDPRAPGRLEHGRRCGAAVPARRAREGGVGRAGRPALPVRLRRYGRSRRRPRAPDGTGSGAGAANPDFVAALAAGDTTADRPASPRAVLRAFYVAPGSLPLDPQLEEAFVAAMNSTRTGVDHYPGEPVAVRHGPGWPPADAVC